MPPVKKDTKAKESFTKVTSSVQGKLLASEDVTSGQKTILVQTTVVDAKGEFVKEPKKALTLEVTPFQGEVAKVKVGGSIKKSDNAYGSAEVSVYVSVPCYREEIAEVYKQTSELVKSLLAKEAENAGFLDTPLVDEGDEAPKEVAPSGKKATGKGKKQEEEPEEEEESEEEEEESEEDSEESEEEEIDLKDLIRQVTKADKASLVQIVEDYGLEVEVKSHKKEEALRAAVLAALNALEKDDEEEEESDEDSEDSEESEEEPAHTKADLQKLSVSKLKKIAEEDFELEVSTKNVMGKIYIPKGADEKTQKTAYIKAILAAQEG
jgi:hypothetical protein